MMRKITILIFSTLLSFIIYNAGLCKVVTNDECLGCHSDKGMTMRGPDGKEISLYLDKEVFAQSVHAKLKCVDCHSSITDIPHDRVKKVDCEKCHAESAKSYKGSIHETSKKIKKGPTCQGCHGKHTIKKDDKFPHFVCKSCHPKSYEEYKDSAHGVAAIGKKGDFDEVATCHDCHGGHKIYKKDDPRSAVYHLNLPHTCGKCHANEELAKRHNIPVHNAYQLYMDSIHGRAITKSGLLVSANCIDCHGGHDIRKHTDKKSLVHRENISTTCGKCHAGIVEIFEDSIHGVELKKGNPEAPTCVSCHTAHEISRVEKDTWLLDVINECGTCHKRAIMTYRNDYHGKITTLGFTRVAKCADCHGSHEIQKRKDPRSKINEKNLVDTCKKCHPGSNKSFVKYMIHADYKDKENYPILYYTFVFMTGLLLTVFGFFGIHALLWLPRSWIERYSKKNKKHWEE